MRTENSVFLINRQQLGKPISKIKLKKHNLEGNKKLCG